MDCFFVGVQDMFSTRKCRYQHYQSRLRQMEIRDQCIQHLETISGIYENLSIVTAGLYHALLVRGTLHGTAAGGTHADHTTTISLRLIDRVRCFLRHLIILGMHMMLQHIFFLHRAESP